MIKIETLSVGMLGTNCYLAGAENSKTLYIIDPGAEDKKIINAAQKYAYEKIYVLLTHAHVDHISGLSEVFKQLNPAAVYLNSGDLGLYQSPENAILPFIPAATNLPITTDNLVTPDLTILHTPGHSPGGSAFYFADSNVVFVGDTLFRESVGRTDLPQASWEQLQKSIKEQLFSLPESTTVYSGHGSPTTIGHEKNHNPFL